MKTWSTKKISAAEFNARHPVGTEVRYYPIRGEADHRVTKTRSEAWELGHGAAVVLVDGLTGGVLVQALQVVASGNAGDSA